MPADTGGSTVTSYELQESVSDGVWTQVSTGANFDYLYGVQNTDVPYKHRVRAFNAQGWGDWSPVLSQTTPGTCRAGFFGPPSCRGIAGLCPNPQQPACSQVSSIVLVSADAGIGDDTFDGTISGTEGSYQFNPVKTLQRALVLVQPGGTILLYPGTYQDAQKDCNLDISKAVSIVVIAGQTGSARLSCPGNRVFHITSSMNEPITMRGLAFVDGGGPTLDGGAIHVDNSASGLNLILEACSFSKLQARSGGAIFFRSNFGSLTLTGVSISECTADTQGGALALAVPTVTLEGVNISQNTASFGGGISISAGTLTIDGNSVISQNKALISNVGGRRRLLDGSHKNRRLNTDFCRTGGGFGGGM